MLAITPLDRDIAERVSKGEKIYIKDFYDVVSERLDRLEEYSEKPFLSPEKKKLTEDRIATNKKFKEYLILLGCHHV